MRMRKRIRRARLHTELVYYSRITGIDFYNLICHTAGCGPPILTNSSGTIVSSNYGKVLRRVEVVCNWEIQAHSGQIIALEFEGLDLGYQPCQHSNVLVQNVLDDNVTQTSIPQEMRRICPQTRPPAILSSGNRLFITFTSTSRFGYRGTGMKAKYKIHGWCLGVLMLFLLGVFIIVWCRQTVLC